MTHVTIHSDSTITVGSTITGYCVRQGQAGTEVVKWHNNGEPAPRDLGAVVSMPRARYTLSTEAGQAVFKADFRAAWNAAANA